MRSKRQASVKQAEKVVRGFLIQMIDGVDTEEGEDDEESFAVA